MSAEEIAELEEYGMVTAPSHEGALIWKALYEVRNLTAELAALREDFDFVVAQRDQLIEWMPEGKP